MEILRELAGAPEVCACDFTSCCDVSQPTVSHHLKVLRDAGAVVSERRGNWVFYKIAPEPRRAPRGHHRRAHPGRRRARLCPGRSRGPRSRRHHRGADPAGAATQLASVSSSSCSDLARRSRPDPSEHLKPLVFRAGRRGWVIERPVQLGRVAPRKNGQASRASSQTVIAASKAWPVVDVEPLARLAADVDAELVHRPDRERSDLRRLDARAVDLETVGRPTPASRPSGHLRPGAVVRAEEEYALHGVSGPRVARPRRRQEPLQGPLPAPITCSGRSIRASAPSRGPAAHRANHDREGAEVGGRGRRSRRCDRRRVELGDERRAAPRRRKPASRRRLDPRFAPGPAADRARAVSAARTWARP